MELRVDKNLIFQGEEYSGYEIISVEWELQTNRFYVKTLYFKNKRKYHKLFNHRIELDSTDIDVNQMIQKIHNLH